MRSLDEITQDLQATEDEISMLYRQSPEAALLHPNCPSELWWQGVALYPWMAVRSPVFPLILLEDPTRWTQPRRHCVMDWIKRGTDRLDHRESQHWAADCGDRLYQRFHDQIPNRARTAFEESLSVRRQYAEGLVSYEPWYAARSKVTAALGHGALAASWKEVGRALSTPFLKDLPYFTKNALDLEKEPAEEAMIAELLWQWDRLLFYLENPVFLQRIVP